MARVAFSKVSVKSQTVLPKEVRERLGLKPGDMVRYRMEHDVIVLEKVQQLEQEDPFATFSEWGTAEDDSAYADL